jgi:hypothetical protein
MAASGFQQARLEDLAPRQQTHFAPSHIGTDPLSHLPAMASDKLRALRQRASDLHSVIPDFDEIRTVHLAVIGHQQRIGDLMRHPSEGGFGLDADAVQVVTEQKLLEQATAELERLKSLQEIRRARWATCGQLERSIVDWLRSGIPGDCRLVAIDDAPVAELLKKGESMVDAVGRYRRRLRECVADLHHVKSAPHTSQEAKAAARQQINQLADAAEPDVSNVVELLEPIRFTTTSTQTLAPSLDPQLAPAIVQTETQDSLGLICWLFRRELTEKIEHLIDQISADGEALSEKQRQEQEAEISAEIRAIQAAEVAVIWAAEAQGEIIDFRSDTSPAAVLGIELETRPRGAPLPGTSAAMAIDL